MLISNPLKKFRKNVPKKVINKTDGNMPFFSLLLMFVKLFLLITFFRAFFYNFFNGFKISVKFSVFCSVADPDPNPDQYPPDPHAFGPHGS
jgi:hypothetical protein